jgi:outer membrane protein assembly factor BamA
MRRAILLFLLVLCVAVIAPLSAQDTPTPPPPPIDSIVVEGAQRVPPTQVIATSGLVLQQRPSYRDIQSAVSALFRSGQYDDDYLYDDWDMDSDDDDDDDDDDDWE